MAENLKQPLPEELMERFYAGDDLAFGDLSQQQRLPLVFHAMRKLPRHLPARLELAEDLVADVLLKVWRTRGRARAAWVASKGTVGGWLSGILQNQLKDYLRTRRSSERLVTDWSAENPGSPSLESQLLDRYGTIPEKLAADDDQNRLLEAIEVLPAPLPDILLMKFQEGKKHREIAAKFGVSEPTVTRRLQDAEERLKGLLGVSSEKSGRATCSLCNVTSA